MTDDYTSEPLWINEPDWLCEVELLNDEDPEGRDLAADTIGYLLGYAHLTNTRSLALIGDPSEMVYEILFSFLPLRLRRKDSYGISIRSNNDLGSEYIDNDLIQACEGRGGVENCTTSREQYCLPLALTRALLVATTVCSSRWRIHSINDQARTWR